MKAAQKLKNYILSEKLGESLQAVVYKAYLKEQPELPLILKQLKFLSGWADLSRYLRQKIERLKVLRDKRSCTPLAMESDLERHFIVQPWFAGNTLDAWSEGQKKLALADFFSIACSMADILRVVHEAGIVHGGIKPHNILVQAETLSVCLTDFITPLDIRDISHFIYDSGFVRGTLAYTSPEQTGRINHRVDFTTDLYSLGVVFYELLTGRLPFLSTDPLELIHSHLAEIEPVAHECNPSVPSQISEIIAKLLSKSPERRYQSAGGLLADLLRCRDEYLATNAIIPFQLGLLDSTKRIIFISKMVGRKAEADLILDEYLQVTQGAFLSVFVSGLSGIGKTRLIQELQKPLVEHRGYFTSGKFDQYQKNIPYSSLIQALRGLLRTVLTESDSRIDHWNRRILAAVEQLGRILTDVIPELELVIGVQPEVAPLPPAEARHRFNQVFANFLSCLACTDHPLVLFIDDLQWCDTATLELLRYVFANHGEYQSLLFLGAYRHNEVDASHPFCKLLREIKEIQAPVKEIRLGELNGQHCQEMVAYILDVRLEEVDLLARFIAELTEGNPLFVSESLSYLHEEKLLFRDSDHQWHWDMNLIRETRMPTSVVGLFSSKVRQLPKDTLHILNYCACMGNRFTVEEMVCVMETDSVALFEKLKPVLSLGMLLENKTDLQFVHDRVQEAVLNQTDEQARASIHWCIGNRLLAAIPDDEGVETSDKLFAIATHLNRGCPQEVDLPSIHRLVQVNFHAGNKALESLASEAANGFFRRAFENLPPDAWDAAYQMTYRIHQRLAKTELMCGRYEASEALINQLIERSTGELDKSEALAEQTSTLSSFGSFKEAIASANRGLAYFDQAIPEDAELANQRTQSLMRQIEAQGDVWGKILDLPFTQDRRSKIELSFYSELIPDLYMSGLVSQLYLAAAQSTWHCLAGDMDESVIYSFSIMGLNLGEQGRFDQAARYEDLARHLCAKYPNTFGATRGMNGIVWCNMHSRSHPADIVEYCLKGIQCGKNCGDLYNAGLSYGPLMWNLHVLGNDLGLIEEHAEECLQFSRKNQLSFSVGLAEAVLAGWVVTMQRDAQPVPMEETLARWAIDNHVALAGSYFALLGFAQYYLGDYQAAAESLAAVERYLNGLTDNVLKRLWFVFRILNRLGLNRASATPAPWGELEEEIKPWLQKVEIWSHLGPLLRPYLAFIKAELARTRGELREARNLYLDAIDEAQVQGYVLLSAHLYECLGRLLQPSGPISCSLYLNEALRLYRACRATAKEAQLWEALQLDRDAKPVPELSVRTPVKPGNTSLDISYLMKSVLAISTDADLQQLQNDIIKVVLEYSGAQHGFLLQKNGDTVSAIAESHIDQHRTVKARSRSLNLGVDVCLPIVNYVFRTGQKIVLRDACVEGDFTLVTEVQSLRLRSVLCFPITDEGGLRGVIYLENRLADGVFTSENTGLTELLASLALKAQKDSSDQETELVSSKASILASLMAIPSIGQDNQSAVLNLLNGLAQQVAMKSMDEKWAMAAAVDNEHLVSLRTSELQATQTLLEKLASQVPGMLYQLLLSPDGESCFPYSSEGIRKIFELAPEDVRNSAKYIFGRLHPEDIDLFKASMLQAANTLTPWHCEFRVVLPQQGVVWREGSAMPERMADGAILWHGFISNINLRKRTEIEYRTVIDTASDGFWVVDDKGHFLDINAAFCDMVGYTREELLDMRISDIEAMESSAEISERIDKIKVSRADRFETRHRHKSGRLLDVEVAIKLLPSSEGRMFVFARDITERRKMDAMLRESENRFRSLANHAPVLIWMADTNTLCTWFNQKWLDFTGRAMEQEIGNGWAEGVHPDDFQPCLAIYLSHFDRREPFRMEYRLKRSDGEYRWIQDNGEPLYDFSGTFVGYIGSCIDISDQRNALEKVRESEERLNFAFEGSRDGMWDWNIKTDRAYFSKQWKAMLGYADDEIGDTIKDWQRLIHPMDEPQIMTDLQAYFDGLTATYDNEHRLLCKDGSYKWILTRGMMVSRDSEGNPARMIGTHTDMTTRKTAEAVLSASESRFRSLFENMPVAYQSLDIQGRFIDVNQRMSDLLGYTRDELLGKAFDEVWLDDLRPSFDPAFDEFKSNGAVATELSLIGKDGRCITALLEGRIQRDIDGNFVRTHCVLSDISARKQVEVEVLKAKIEAERLAQAKSEFLANMSHEIRTPMNAVLGILQLLQFTELSEQQLDYTGKAQSAAQSLLGILNDILDYSKIEAGRLEFENAPFQVNRLLNNLSSVLSTSLQGKDIELVIDCDADIPRTLLGDSLRLQQVLLNLASNAIKFTERGEVVVSVRVVEHKLDRVWVEFAVRDTGIGIPVDKLETIFGEFNQAEASTTRRFGGTGLGLTISQRLVSLMGSDLTVVSTPGCGSCFAFTLEFPIGNVGDELTASSSITVGRHGTDRLKGLHLLVVEDNLVNQMVAKNLLTLEGAQVEVAGDGLEGVERVLTTQQPFDAVLMDVQMPKMDGFAATRMLRQHKSLAQMPIIAMTANALASDQADCLASGMNAHIAKPIKVEALIALVRQYCINEEGTPTPAGLSHSANTTDDTGPLACLPDVPAGFLLEAALQRFACNRELYAVAVRQFLGEQEDVIHQIRQHLQQGDTSPAAHCLHTLKGVAATLGAQSLAYLANETEISLKTSNTPDKTEDLLARLATALNESFDVLKNLAHAFDPPAASEPLVDPVRVIAYLDALDPLLSENNLRALEIHAVLKREFGSGPQNPLTPLHAAINRLDFSAALTESRKLRELLT
ncbi:MAG: hypothetical protein DM484_18245 [Candidatus Methylumidiphilus alinenensis]|uniref:Sensory/regulatory protein RpfC n=1 Tax=Candidatus Methylumidiphilus alinenensis TaxID=2202197 RepID=A0A2W4SYW8_9GAMM|nr:MAG: hypothetical protein DM484_18245 [Candidatus Methylumidiphilus alinenensis]